MMIKKPKSKTGKPRSNGLLKSIGPVENLESYVKADWWREIFNANYLRTDGDVVEDDAVTKTEIDLFLIASCIKLFERLECRDYARFDWRLDANGTPRLLEANPNPGWCWDGHPAKMAKFAGISYAEMLDRILKASEERFNKADKNI